MEINRRKYNWFLGIMLLFAISQSCQENTDSTGGDIDLKTINLDTEVNPVDITDSVPYSGIIDTQIDSSDCRSLSVEAFKSFIGINYGMSESDVLQNKILGDFDGGAYSDDQKVFIYKYNSIPTAPVEFWVDTESGKVITVFLELLSKDQGFMNDLEKVKEGYKLDECLGNIFGMSAETIINELGEPAEDAVSKDGVRLLAYDDAENDISVSFKLYPDQNSACTSIAVHWFYAGE